MANGHHIGKPLNRHISAIVRGIATKFAMMTLFDLLNLATNKNLIFKTKMADGRCPDKFAVDILKATQLGTEPVSCGCRWGVYWRNLASTTEPSVCGGDAALCQITDYQ